MTTLNKTWDLLSGSQEAVIVVGLFLIALLALVVVAFREGREISFWPPKIGARPTDGGLRVPLPAAFNSPLDSSLEKRLSELERKVLERADLENLTIRGASHQVRLDREPFWRWSPYSFDREEFISPRIVDELLGWISDPRETIAAVDLVAANRSNRFHGDFSVIELEGRNWARWIGENQERFLYSLIAISPTGVHMVECRSSGGGTLVSSSIALLVFEPDQVLDYGSEPPSLQSRILLKQLGSIGLGDRYKGDIRYEGGVLMIGPDQGWFQRGEAARKEVRIG